MREGDMLPESILAALTASLLPTPLADYLTDCRGLPSLVPLPLSAVSTIPFTSSVRLIAARSTDFAGSSEKEEVSEQRLHEGARKRPLTPCSHPAKLRRNGRTTTGRVCAGVDRNACGGKIKMPGVRRGAWKTARWTDQRVWVLVP